MCEFRLICFTLHRLLWGEAADAWCCHLSLKCGILVVCVSLSGLREGDDIVVRSPVTDHYPQGLADGVQELG